MARDGHEKDSQEAYDKVKLAYRGRIIRFRQTRTTVSLAERQMATGLKHPTFKLAVKIENLYHIHIHLL